MSFSILSYWVQHVLGFGMLGATALLMVSLLVLGGGRLVQLALAGRHAKPEAARKTASPREAHAH